VLTAAATRERLGADLEEMRADHAEGWILKLERLRLKAERRLLEAHNPRCIRAGARGRLRPSCGRYT